MGSSKSVDSVSVHEGIQIETKTNDSFKESNQILFDDESDRDSDDDGIQDNTANRQEAMAHFRAAIAEHHETSAMSLIDQYHGVDRNWFSFILTQIRVTS